MRREMAFADVASWRLKAAAADTAVVGALATTGSGVNSHTLSQEFTLHVELARARPITRVDASERSQFP